MTDRYLKTVLTVIAGALVWIAVQLTIGEVRAASKYTVPTLSMGDIKNYQALRDSTPLVPVYCVNCR